MLMFGLEPGLLGSVETLLITYDLAGGSMFLILNLTNAFWTGRIPNDLRFLNPRILTSIL